MTGSALVVADTTPLNYLTIIGQVHVLGALFGKVLVPEGVLAELKHPKAPIAVVVWSQSLPEWVQVTRVTELDHTIPLGNGEVEAISLALEKGVDIVLLDERKGRDVAQSRGLLAVGTLSLIDIADEMGLLNGIAALNDLRNTTFRADPRLLERLEVKMCARRS
jgi:predicted nucleic acid-binding protein